MPPGSSTSLLKGDGFFWYDTGQEHIITRATFRNCGYRSEQYNQYDTSPTRGCGEFELIEVPPESPMTVSIAYPLGTTFTLTAHAAWCTDSASNKCQKEFTAVNTVEKVRNGLGNTYHVDENGVITFRVIQTPQSYVGIPIGSCLPMIQWERGGKDTPLIVLNEMGYDCQSSNMGYTCC